MRFIVTENYEEMSYIAAQETAKFIRENPKLVLGLSTGGTPLGTYQELIKLHEKEKLDFSQVVTFNLDEYIGLEPNHPQSYTRYTWDNFLSKVNIQKQNVHIPPGIFNDDKQVLKEYDQKMLEAGGIDVQVLGVGGNGHIGFNEPSELLNSHTHIASLTDKTIKDNARFFSNIEEVPRKAIAMGVGSILKAKHIIFIANGSEKADAVKKTFNGRITTDCPSSLLQLHANLTVILDKKAAKLLN
ncbi:glucosamine-6-phosphate deaminase [Priestia megaterium]|uniref:glucosamine-6-phosphate deaminase n=1 Tax=Priestia megaterium TaxID=1404 RepID=UPI000BF346C3|nr:glucosamine-6-phosphate deaminase [Priestia megaterium]NGY70106.1 glucosamine-6-phosphate deaminase [Priestia megaterium]PFT49512.1 glucosamine-6-phosphate deaminase [Priestia megaterium]